MSRARPDIVVIGGINTDYIARAERLPAGGDAVSGDVFARGSGGKGANQAAVAAVLGAAVRLIGAVGDDERGRQALHHLTALGVETSGVRMFTGIATGATLIHLDADGETQTLAALAANRRLTPQDVADELRALESARIVLAQLETPVECAVAGFRWAREHGAAAWLDLSPATALDAHVLALVDLVRVDAEEARALTGVHPRDRDSATEAARRLTARGPRSAIVGAGTQGNLLLEEGPAQWLAALPVDTVDRTGAGDAFMGALAASIARGDSLADAFRVAHAAAALATTAIGAHTRLPSWEDIRGLLTG